VNNPCIGTPRPRKVHNRLMARPVTVISTGGTIAMAGPGGGAVPALGADALIEGLGVPVHTRDVVNKPSVQLEPADVVAIGRAVAEELDGGRAVVVTCGTDCLEEVAVALDAWSDGPVVLTGAMRHAGLPGADGPANVADAVTVAGSLERGVVVCFAGEVHAARELRKVDSTSVRAFGSPGTGPLGRVAEGTLRLHREAPRTPVLAPPAFEARVEVALAGLAGDGSAVRALAAIADGLVIVVLGAGHTPPPFLEAVRSAAESVPVVATVRPQRGEVLRSTYAFEGAEPDLWASGAVVAGHLSPAAARVLLVAWLGAGSDRPDLGTFLAP